VRDPGPVVDPAAPLTLGTAGHVDHGKTALVAALTGTDTDRLPEEKARGMSIELGYAELALPSGRRISVVDVPGHERFVRTMVAGATGIDCYLMVIAADEGVSQQTREHARVLRSLGVGTGVVAITKTDLADPRDAIQAAGELMAGAEVVSCCARSVSTLTDLIAALDRATGRLKSRALDGGPVVMHIDRSFTLTGIGTVVTGTLSSGTVAAGDKLVLHPSDIEVRVRAVQVHGEDRDRGLAGQRVAVNLARLARSQVSRGDVLAARGAVTASHFLDVQLDFEPSPAQAQSRSWRVQVHHGTRSTPARIVPLFEARLAQLRCQAPLLARPGERVVIRDVSHRDTLGGALIVNPLARRHGPAGAPIQTLRRLLAGEQQPARSPSVAPDPGEPEPAAPPVALALSPAALTLAERLRDEGFSPSPDRLLDTDDLVGLRAHGLAVRLVHGRHAHLDAIAAAAARVTAIIQAEGQISLPRLRDELGVSRADAKAFLDYFDSTGLTLRRHDDARVLRASRNEYRGSV
jgi:selenocysteine-specific elongation factor